MKKFPFKKLDAFASHNSSGNPAGYIHLSSFDDITDCQMFAIAKELRYYVNEVGFMAKQEDGVFRLRYFSAEQEVQFCGHATVAIMYDIIKNDLKLINQSEVKIRINKEQLIVQNKINEEDTVFIMAPTPEFKDTTISTYDVAKAFDLDVLNIVNTPEIINAGLDTLLVELDSLHTILGLQPEIMVIKELCLKYGADIIEVFCEETTHTANTYRTRVFAPKFGYLEDPATGSGNSAFGYYLLKHDRWDGEIILLEQNGYHDNFNVVKIKSNNQMRVLFGGKSFIKIQGEYTL